MKKAGKGTWVFLRRKYVWRFPAGYLRTEMAQENCLTKSRTVRNKLKYCVKRENLEHFW